MDFFKGGQLLKLQSDAAVGGGRAVLAAAPIQPGTLLLRELPAITVPEDKSDEVRCATCYSQAVLWRPQCSVQEPRKC
jgi:hypothetical protein